MPILNAAIVLALQADSGAAPVGATLAQGPGALMDMMSNIGGVAMFVLALLLFASLYSWTVILGKIVTFGRATKESRNFIRAFRKASRLQEIAAVAENYKSSPLAQVFD
jgi:biopolymer transport protein TolQ